MKNKIYMVKCKKKNWRMNKKKPRCISSECDLVRWKRTSVAKANCMCRCVYPKRTNKSSNSKAAGKRKHKTVKEAELNEKK